MNRSQSIALACILAQALLPAARAQSFEDTVRACAAERDSQRRLACYDAAVAQPIGVHTPSTPAPGVTPSSIATASGATASAPAARTAPTAGTVSAAGTVSPSGTAPAAKDFGVRNGPLDVRRHATEPHEITAAVTGIERRAGGLLVVALDNGQVWIQNQASDYFPLKVGDNIEIRAASLGSYMLLAPSKRFTHVTRIR